MANALRSKLVTLLVALALTSPFPAAAALINLGDVTRDTKTGLEWLDVTLSAGLDFRQIVAGEGGWFADGWRYASEFEVRALMQEYVAPTPYTQGIDPGAASILDYLGITATFPGIPHARSYALYDDALNAPFSQFVGRADIFVNYDSSGFPRSASWVMSNDMQSIYAGSRFIGSFLVKASSVPEPDTWALLLLGIGGILFAGNRGRNTKHRNWREFDPKQVKTIVA